MFAQEQRRITHMAEFLLDNLELAIQRTQRPAAPLRTPCHSSVTAGM